MFRAGDSELIDGELLTIIEVKELDDKQLLRCEDGYNEEKFYSFDEDEDEFEEITEEKFYEFEFFEEFDNIETLEHKEPEIEELELEILENNELMNNLPNEIIEINISYGLLLRNMPKLVLTSSQKQWIKNLKNNGTFIAYNDNLLDVI